jgi:hypothetical protein
MPTPVNDLHGRLAAERASMAQTFVENHAKGVDVGAAVDLRGIPDLVAAI